MTGPSETVGTSDKLLLEQGGVLWVHRAVDSGAGSVAPDAAQRQPMVMVNQNRVGLLQCCLAQEPTIDVLQLLGSNLVDTVAHGGKTEIRAVGDEDGEQRTIGVAVAGLVPAERLRPERSWGSIKK